MLFVLAVLAFGCGDDGGGDRSEDRERVKRVVASYTAAYLEGRGEDACALYTAELRERIERAALQRGVRGCELGQLRDYVRSAGYPRIRDASPNFKLGPQQRAPGGGYVRRPGEFLELERRELQKLGYERRGEYWVHPNGG
ncbi:MAG TPA: hypothetical protein VE270_08150 [Thermoleophilaceae bacterium]|nr:hypothetical protein [Thermoleophilaceae bacterium]